MRHILILLLLAGCAAAPVNPWDTVEVPTEPAITPLDCSEWPLPVDFTDTSLAFDLDGARLLDAYRACAEANAVIASENAKALDKTNEAVRDLVDAGQAQRRIAEMRAEMLDDERKHHFWQSIGYYVVIIGLGLAI